KERRLPLQATVVVATIPGLLQTMRGRREEEEGRCLWPGRGLFPPSIKARGAPPGRRRIFGVPNTEQGSEKDCKAVWKKGLQGNPKEHCARHNFDFLKSQARSIRLPYWAKFLIGPRISYWASSCLLGQT
ncbi:hypothetical protein Taro_010553, partial [Colocasia esculenta]|nr:hypothetical protein [Colocasia esculenta]